MKIFMGLLLLLTSHPSFALATSEGGGMATGGGAGVVCRDKNSAILRVELLDLYEAQVRDRLTLTLSTGHAKKDYIQAVHRVYATQGAAAALIPSVGKLQAHYDSFFRAIHWISVGKKIPLLRDQGSTISLPKNCALEQIALFHDEDGKNSENIEMDRLLWEKLPPLHQAALIWHELNYKHYRLLGDVDSEITRAEVASVFVANKKIPVHEGLPPVGAIVCIGLSPAGGKLSKFFIFPSSVAGEHGKWIWQFTQLMGRPILEKTFAVLDSNLPVFGKEFKVIGQGEAQMIFPSVRRSESSFVQKTLIKGVPGLKWELLLESQPGEPVKLSIHHKGKLLGSNFVAYCSK